MKNKVQICKRVFYFFVCSCLFFSPIIAGAYADGSGLTASHLVYNLYDPVLSEARSKFLKDKTVVRDLIYIAENRNEDWKIQIRIIRLLAETRDPMVVDTLMSFITDPMLNYDCPALKWNALIAIGDFNGERRIVDLLIETIKDSNSYIKEAAIHSIGKIGASEAVPTLIAVLREKNDDFAIKLAAVKALGSIGDKAAAPVLTAIVNDAASDTIIIDESLAALKKLR